MKTRLGSTRIAHLASRAAVPAVLLLLAAAVVTGYALEGYSHGHHPLALLGAHGVPGADAFNLFGWGLPGLLLAVQAVVLRECLPSGRRSYLARMGAWMLVLSAAAFAAQGIWPLDPADIDGPASQRHAVAWMLWWIAYVAGAGMLAAGDVWFRSGRARFALLVSAVAVLGFVLAARAGLSPALAGRLAIIAWLGGYLACGTLMRRPQA